MIPESLLSPPRHVALIMDGNGRWAAARGLPRSEGHLAAGTALHRTIQAALDLGIEWLTVYAFSTENWGRSAVELEVLLRPGLWLLPLERGVRLRQQRVRCRIMGDLLDSRIPAETVLWANKLQDYTSRQSPRLNLNIAFNYGGRQEILRAAQHLNGIHNKDMSVKAAFESHLWIPELPDLDFLVRTGGEQRLSNFMLWQVAYTELLFLDIMWPDFGHEQLVAALQAFARRDRRWGRTHEAP